MKSKTIVFSLIGLWIIATVTDYLARVEWGIAWLPAALRAVSHICGGLTILLAVYGLWLLLWPYLKTLFGGSAKQEPAAIEEAPQVTRTVQNLNEILAGIENDTGEASVLLLDAETFAHHLVNLVQAIALKADAMAEESEQLREALAAITTQDPLRITEAAGSVKDSHIRSLMLTKVRAPGYWQDTAILISAQRGTLQQWTAGYRVFAGNLMSEISRAKSQLAASAAALELVGASRPLLQVKDSLERAGELLQIQRKPGLEQAARQLPAINAGLLK